MIIYFLSRSTCLHVCWLLAGNLLEGLITSWLPSAVGLPLLLVQACCSVAAGLVLQAFIVRRSCRV